MKAKDNEIKEGCVVHYVLSEQEHHRPAVIVKVWSQNTGCSDLKVFPDQDKDRCSTVKSVFFNGGRRALYTWHWMERLEEVVCD